MPDYRRLYVPGGTYFLTAAIAHRPAALLTRHIDDLHAAWDEVKTALPFETLARIILPDHFHCLIRLPEGDHDFSTRMKRIKARFSRRVPKSADFAPGNRPRERGIWQRRFWEHLIRDSADFDAHVGYIHNNPVKHGLVTHPDDWPYSTWHDWKRDYAARPIPRPSTGIRITSASREQGGRVDDVGCTNQRAVHRSELSTHSASRNITPVHRAALGAPYGSLENLIPAPLTSPILPSMRR